MTSPSPAGGPLRVAIIGSGPAAFYVAEHLLKALDDGVSIDVFERLPAPFGLVRYGVAPDHQKIKNVTRVYERIVSRPNVRFFGNVEYGRHVALDALGRHYHQVCFATGAQTDRRLGIPGEDLPGSFPATEFVAWYNGHPDFRECAFDLSVERAVVIGIGNVAVDVARILCRTADELRKTDIADHALEALAESRVREVVMLGRRGPAQAAFTNPEVRELGEMPGADFVVRPDELELDPASADAVLESKELAKKLEILRAAAARAPEGRARRLVLRFLVSPAAFADDGSGRLGSVRIVRNRLVARDDGRLAAEATDETEILEAGLAFRSVGYRGVPLPGLPFDERRGVVPNEAGRIVGGGGAARPGLDAAGWIKRGPSGVIGTNKPDAGETVATMVEDWQAGRTLAPGAPGPSAVDALLEAVQPRYVSHERWSRIDRLELERGEREGRPRVKFATVDELLEAAACP